MTQARLSQLQGKILAGKYLLRKPLSEGGMGHVFLAEHTLLHEPRAIKIIRAELIDNEAVRKRFLQEIKATHLVSKRNEHIVSIYDDFGFEHGLGYYVMEFLDGRSLADAIDKQPGTLPLLWCTRVAREICDAMQTAHDAGIIHRDLKPDNIFLIHYRDQPDFVKVVDFGIAKSQHSEHQLTATGAVLGTLCYMAPEQIVQPINQDGETVGLDHRVDIYALGCMLFQMLAGRPPFCIEGTDSLFSRNKVLMAHLQEEPPELFALRADVPRALAAIVAKTLAKAPEKRYPSMQSFREALLAWEATIADCSPAAFVPTGVFEVDVRQGDTSSKAPKLPWLAAGIVALLAALGVGWWLRPVTPPPSPSSRARIQLRPSLPLAFRKADQLVNDGNQALLQKKYLRAASVWKQVTHLPDWQKSKHYPGLFLGIGNAYSRANYLHLTKRYYRRYIKASAPQHPEATRIKEQLLPKIQKRLLRRQQRAVGEIGRIAKSLQRDQFREALTHYSLALAHAPSLPSLHLGVGQSIQGHFPALALSHFRKALEQFEPDAATKTQLQQRLQEATAQLRQQQVDLKQLKASIVWMLASQQYRRALRLWSDPKRLSQRLRQPTFHLLLKDWIQQLAQVSPTQASRWLALYIQELKRLSRQGLLRWIQASIRSTSTPHEIPSPAAFKQMQSSLRQLPSITQLEKEGMLALKQGNLPTAHRKLSQARRRWKRLQTLGSWAFLPKNTAIRARREAFFQQLTRAMPHYTASHQAYQSALFADVPSVHQRLLTALADNPALSAIQRLCLSRARSIKRATHALSLAQLHLKRKRWKQALSHLKVYQTLFPKAHNQAMISRQMKLCQCELGTPWMLCQKSFRNK